VLIFLIPLKIIISTFHFEEITAKTECYCSISIIITKKTCNLNSFLLLLNVQVNIIILILKLSFNFKLEWIKIFSVLFIIVLLPFAGKSSAQVSYWKQCEGPFSGTVRSMYRAQDGKMFAGSCYAIGGIYLSTNDGYNWRQIGSFGDYIYTFCMNKKNGSLYVGTSYGIYCTTDLGKNWRNKSSGLQDLNTISIDIDYSNGFMYAVTMHSTSSSPDPIKGIHLSTNNGDSWINISNGIETKNIYNVFVDSVSKRLFCGSLQGVLYSTNFGQNWKIIDLPGWSVYSIIRSKISNQLILGQSNGVFISNDNGESWNKITDIKDTYWLRQLIEIPGTGEIIASNNQKIYILKYEYNDWQVTKTISGIPYSINDCNINSKGEYFISTDLNGIYISRNNGSSWDAIGVANASVRTIFKHPKSGNIFIGTLKGPYILSEQCNSWALARMLPMDVRAFTIANNNVFLAGAYDDNKIYLSYNNGLSWEQTGSGLPKSVIVLKVNKRTKTVFAGTYDGIFKSTDNGNNWRPVGNGINFASIKAILSDKNDEEILAGTSSGIYLSNNDGESWQYLRNDLSDKFIWCLASNDKDGYIYSGTYYDGVFRSKDFGRNWEQIITSLVGLNIRSIVVNSKGEVFAASHGAGIYRLNRDGKSWSDLNLGLYNSYVNTLFVDIDDKIYAGVENGGVYYSTDAIIPVSVFPGDANHDCKVDLKDIYPLVRYYGNEGDGRFNANVQWLQQKVYFSKGWEPVESCYADCDGDGLVNSKDVLPVIYNWGNTCVGINAEKEDDIVICETLLLELDKFPRSESVNKLREEILNFMKTKLRPLPLFLLKQNYPNPFNSSTQIRYFIPQETKEIKFIVYSAIGQIMWKRSVPDVLPGYHEIFFEAIDETNKPFCSGVYYLVMYIKESYQVIRMLMIK
jgi:photosystem II stability/assembly factor-like uncharacterized protein